MGAMLAAGGLINGGALLGMLSNTHTRALIFSSKSERTEGHTGGEWHICVCECSLCQSSQTSNWPPELWFIAACHCPNVCKSMRLIIDHVCVVFFVFFCFLIYIFLSPQMSLPSPVLDCISSQMSCKCSYSPCRVKNRLPYMVRPSSGLAGSQRNAGFSCISLLYIWARSWCRLASLCPGRLIDEKGSHYGSPSGRASTQPRAESD